MISVVIATYGDKRYWDKIARTALASVNHWGWDNVVRIHGETLAKARNRGALLAKGCRVVFLDADDQLEYHFAEKVREHEDILQPKTVFRTLTDESQPSWIEPRERLTDGNHIVVGAPVNRQAFLDSGGFDEYEIAEDWALWLKMKKAGASFGRTEATYIVNVNEYGRNSQPDNGCIDRIRKRFT